MALDDPRQYLNDPEEVFRLGFEGKQAGLWTAIPAIVQAVDLTKMTVDCQVAIQGRYIDQNGNLNWINISQILDMPIVFPRAGGFTLTLPISVNDEVLAVFASRCIDSWWQNGGYSNKPMEYRMHDLSDGFAIPGPTSQPNVITNISPDSAQLRTDDGSSYIELTKTGGINMVGNLTVTGNITATQEVTAQSAATPVTLSTHVHTGVTTGSGSTGGPVG